MTEADERRLKERYEGGMGGLSEEAHACAPDVLWLIEQVKKYQNLHAKMTVYAEQVEYSRHSLVVHHKKVLERARIALTHAVNRPHEHNPVGPFQAVTCEILGDALRLVTTAVTALEEE